MLLLVSGVLETFDFFTDTAGLSCRVLNGVVLSFFSAATLLLLLLLLRLLSDVPAFTPSTDRFIAEGVDDNADRLLLPMLLLLFMLRPFARFFRASILLILLLKL